MRAGEVTRGPSCRAWEPRARLCVCLNDGKQWEDLNDRLHFAFFSFSVSYGEEIEAD